MGTAFTHHFYLQEIPQVRTHLLRAAFLIVPLLALSVGCERTPSQKVEDSVDAAANRVEDAGDAVLDTVENAGDSIENATDNP